MSYDRKEFFIDGRWVAPASSGTIEVVSPHTEEVIASVPDGSPADIDAAVAAARRAFDEGPWRRFGPQERADALDRLAQAYSARLDELATTISAEMGAPILFSQLAQVPVPLMMLQYFSELARSFEFEERRQGPLSASIVRHEPVGVVGAIAPWNVPQFTAMSKLAPALAAGCTAVLKPSPETPLDGYLLAEAVLEAELPEGVVNIVAAGRESGEHLVTHPGIDKVAFTGSTAAGRRIASLCGERLRPVTLELGGKSAAIVLDDVDLEAFTEGLTLASFLNNGQGCIAQTRILASAERYDEVLDAVAGVASSLCIGDPMDPGTEIGPLVSERQRSRVEGYLEVGRQEGARVVTGGGRPNGMDRGWYVEPTVFADVDNSMRIAREEIFGPVLVVIRYEDEADAIRIANDSEYGLAGSVWTSDEEHGADVARAVETGTLGINKYVMDLASPFGGWKASGLGYEFGPEGLLAYLRSKSIAV
ncbi:MAG: aldehyde dehydrogenase [Microthrixaceae bacterium]|nr:aldehyde dehydrogenase [Microthrixaceae bacterium]